MKGLKTYALNGLTLLLLILVAVGADPLFVGNETATRWLAFIVTIGNIVLRYFTTGPAIVSKGS